MHELWKWTEQKEKAAMLCFDGQLTRAQIAANCCISERQLVNWITAPQFQERLVELRSKLNERLTGVPFITKEARLIALSALAVRAKKNFEDHELLLETRPVPGGMLVNETFNSGAFNAAVKAMADISAELGDRKVKVDLSGEINHSGVLQVISMDVPPELLTQYISVGTKISKGGEILDALPSPPDSAQAELPSAPDLYNNESLHDDESPPSSSDEDDLDAQAAELQQVLRDYGFFNDATQADILARYLQTGTQQTDDDN